MCGIFGLVQLEPELAPAWQSRAEKTLEVGLERIAHRGPDEEGMWVGPGAALGVRRLSILDLAGGSQPIWNDARTTVIVYNGEVYNFLDLRAELEGKGHTFRTRTDTEVVLRAYEEWGMDCVRRLNGMFAFAIWDAPRRRLFLARDRIGEKPLYYSADGGQLVFGSEIKALLADPDMDRSVDPRGIANYLAFGHSLAPDTIYRGIKKLLPGHYLVAEDGGLRTQEYWDVGSEPQLEAGHRLAEGEYAERIRSLLDDSVRRRMIADVPVGAFLSGGLDSSAVVSLMVRHATDAVKTFSVGFEGGRGLDEREDAAAVARALGTEHHELRLGHVDLVETLRTLVYHYDEPFADPAGFPVYLLSRFAREHVKVVLTGDGGDELFGGYRRYVADQLAPLYGALPGVIGERAIPALVGRLPRLRRVKRAADVLSVPDPARRYAAWLTIFTPEMRAELIEAPSLMPVGGHDPAAIYPRYYDGLDGEASHDHLNRLMYVDLKTWLADDYMEKTDKATMACSLEARIPILDHRLVELAFQIPGSLKIRGMSTKRIFKKAVAPLVPASVLRKRKHGFTVPTDAWFRGSLRSFAFEVLLDGQARTAGYFNRSVVERLWREHASGRHVWDAQLWLLLNFELWRQTYRVRVDA